MNKLSTLAANGNGEQIPTVIGIDLAKNVFAVHAVNRHGKPVLVKPMVRRDQLLELLAQLPSCIIGMEACSGAHPLGPATGHPRPYTKTDGAKIHHPLPHPGQARQERRQ
jgi:hypothetical protein